MYTAKPVKEVRIRVPHSTHAFIQYLNSLKEGERIRIRYLSGKDCYLVASNKTGMAIWGINIPESPSNEENCIFHLLGWLDGRSNGKWDCFGVEKKGDWISFTFSKEFMMSYNIISPYDAPPCFLNTYAIKGNMKVALYDVPGVKVPYYILRVL